MKEAYYRDGAKNRGDRVSNDQREMWNIAVIASTGNTGLEEGASELKNLCHLSDVSGIESERKGEIDVLQGAKRRIPVKGCETLRSHRDLFNF